MAERKNFGKLREVLEIPNLIGIQTKSYEAFLQKDVPCEEKNSQGLHEVFQEIFPIESYDKQYVLGYERYTLGAIKTDVVNCLKDGRRIVLLCMSSSGLIVRER